MSMVGIVACTDASVGGVVTPPSRNKLTRLKRSMATLAPASVQAHYHLGREAVSHPSGYGMGGSRRAPIPVHRLRYTRAYICLSSGRLEISDQWCRGEPGLRSSDR